MAANGRVVGLIDRKGIPADTQSGNPGWRAVLAGGIPNDGSSPSGGISWISCQSSRGSPAGSTPIAGSAGAGTIDSAWTTVRAYNTSIGNPALGTGPPYRWGIKLRMQTATDDSGTQCQPNWLFSSSNINTVTSGGTTIVATWNSTGFRSIWQQWLGQLAAYVPAGESLSLANNDLLGEITFAVLVTAESCLVTPFTLSAMGNPSNATLITTFENLYADAIAAFPNTYVSIAFNPASFGGNTTTSTLLSWYLANATWPKPGNNSGRANPADVGGHPVTGLGVKGPFTGNDPVTGTPWYTFNATYNEGHGNTYATMYTNMWLNGPGRFASQVGGPGFPIASPIPFYEQTSTLAGMGNTTASLANTLSYFADGGVEMIELPSGYAGVFTPAQMGNYGPLLIANYLNQNPGPATPSQLAWPAYRYRH